MSVNENDTNNASRELWNQAVSLYTAGKIKPAGALFEQLTQIDPCFQDKGVGPYFYLGNIAKIERRYAAGIDAFSRSLEQNPLHEPSLLERSGLFLSRHHYVEALADLQRLLDIDPAERQTPTCNLYFALAQLHTKTENYDVALEYARKALALKPEMNHYKMLIAEISAVIGKREFVPSDPG
jgi:tetratricopeptide (TPR) repeat protein